MIRDGAVLRDCSATRAFEECRNSVGRKTPKREAIPLATYLQDHLAGALHAIELLKAMRDHFAGEPLGTFAAEVLAEVEADREVLARMTERAGGTAGGMKEWGAWLAEKVSRLKLKHGSSDGLGTFEALEFLVDRDSRETSSLARHGIGRIIRFARCKALTSLNSLPAPKTSTKE